MHCITPSDKDLLEDEADRDLLEDNLATLPKIALKGETLEESYIMHTQNYTNTIGVI